MEAFDLPRSTEKVMVVFDLDACCVFLLLLEPACSAQHIEDSSRAVHSTWALAAYPLPLNLRSSRNTLCGTAPTPHRVCGLRMLRIPPLEPAPVPAGSSLSDLRLYPQRRA